MDTTNGQSGSAAYINFDPPGALGVTSYLIGVHTGAITGRNRARTLDSTVFSHFASNSDNF